MKLLSQMSSKNIEDIVWDKTRLTVKPSLRYEIWAIVAFEDGFNSPRSADVVNDQIKHNKEINEINR
jgi:hypothetical protein